MKLRDTQFVDLYLGVGFADLRGLPGRHAARQPVPAEHEAEVDRLRQICVARFENGGDARFAIEHDEVMYRVQAMAAMATGETAGGTHFVLRRMNTTIRSFDALALPEPVEEFLLDEARTGLVLIVGEQGVGKTTTAASFLAERLKRYGGVAYAIEDPLETRLDGLHGDGRCIQVPVSQKHGGISRQLSDLMRGGASALLIGEILDPVTASEAALHSVNGMLVISTMHAASPAEAIARLCAFAPDKQAVLAKGVAAVIHQRVEREGNYLRFILECLLVTDPEKASIQSKIKDGAFDLLEQDVDVQRRRFAA